MADFTPPPLDAEATELQKKVVKAELAFIATLAAFRLYPPAARPIARNAFGIELGPAGEVIGLSPLAITNAAPFPFGYAPPELYGLPPNYYLPRGFAKALPEFIPGVPEQRAIDTAPTTPTPPTHLNTADQIKLSAALANFGSDRLAGFLASARAGHNPLGLDNPPAAVGVIEAELARREAQRGAENARLDALQGVTPMASTPPTTTVQGQTQAEQEQQRLREREQARRLLQAQLPGADYESQIEPYIELLRAKLKRLTSEQEAVTETLEFRAQVEAKLAEARFQQRLLTYQAQLASEAARQQRQQPPPTVPQAPGPNPGTYPGSSTSSGRPPSGFVVVPGAGPPGSGATGPSGSPSSGTGVGPSAVPGTAPGSTPGQQGYNVPGVPPSGMFPDSFFQHKQGDP